jgi:hypothetical protein
MSNNNRRRPIRAAFTLICLINKHYFKFNSSPIAFTFSFKEAYTLSKSSFFSKRSTYTYVELDFWLGTGWTAGEFRAVFGEELQYIRRLDTHFARRNGMRGRSFEIGRAQCFVIIHSNNRRACNVLGGLARKSAIICWISSAPDLPFLVSEISPS